MKERPILFSGPMVQALLRTDNPKTQTRRAVKGITMAEKDMVYCADPAHFRVGDFAWVAAISPTATSEDAAKLRKNQHLLVPRHHINEPTPWEDCGCMRVHCPYGEPGDRLWVKETFRAVWQSAMQEPALQYRADGAFRDPKSDEEHNRFAGLTPQPESPNHWRPSIFMPRWASRITLEIVGVRVERLQKISEADAIAEGVTKGMDSEWWHIVSGNGSYSRGGKDKEPVLGDDEGFGKIEFFKWKTMPGDSAAKRFESLWYSINGADSWKANPYVWVIEFKRVGSEVAK